ncbi:MAG: enoyl-CoA hydratase/isomerase family protein [Hyphomicrobiales bacterium]
MTDPLINIEQNDGVVTLRLTRKPANALDIGFLEDIDAALAGLDAEAGWRVLVVTGTDGVFSAGVDLKKLPALDGAAQDRIIHALNRLYTRLYGLSRPTIAAVNGHAIAGGLVLALACDYRIAASQPARFCLTEVQVGVAFPVSALEIARMELAPHLCRNFLLFGGTIDPEAAHSGGIVDELVAPADVMTRARDKAEELKTIPPGGYAAIKAQLREPALTRMRAAVDKNEEPQLGGWVTDEAREAALKVLAGG